MTGTVLVAFGSKNGATAEIAQAVAQTLRKDGLTVEVRPAADVSDLEPYDAVVIGGGLYAGRWHKDARGFVRRQRRQLAGRPVWLFSSGPLDPSASEREIPPVPGVRRAFDRIGAVEHTTFGGCLREGARGRIAKTIVSSGKGGDFRDFTQIANWSSRIAVQLAAGAAGRPEGCSASWGSLRPPVRG